MRKSHTRISQLQRRPRKTSQECKMRRLCFPQATQPVYGGAGICHRLNLLPQNIPSCCLTNIEQEVQLLVKDCSEGLRTYTFLNSFTSLFPSNSLGMSMHLCN
ncbi:uncharacterized protein LOC114670792 [Macaca mulatta]